MNKNILTSIVKHSDYLEGLTSSYGYSYYKWELHRKRVNFGKTQLQLSFFVPCDLEGNVLKKPCGFNNFLEYGVNDFLNNPECLQYQKAKERVLFEGFEYKGETEFSWIFKHNKVFPIIVSKRNVEYLVSILNIEVVLTSNAIKIYSL